jgi:CRISPR/Cas system-associated exonuclease Cas4 (RecB family)
MVNLTHSYSAIKLYENCPLRYFHQRVTKSVVDQGGEASKNGERIHKFLEDRLATNKELPQEVAKYEVLCKSVETLAQHGELHVEKELTLNGNLKPTGWFEPDAWLRSKLDILVIIGNTAYVMDWKTGKRKPDNNQLELFSLQVFKHYEQVDRVIGTFIWLKDNAMDKETYTRDQANDMWARLIKRIKRIEDSLEHNVWPAKPSGLCRFCPARHMCDYARL